MRTSVHFVRLSVLTCLLNLFTLHAKAQSFSFANGKIEVGVGIGPSFFLGDLGGSQGKGKTFVKDVDFPLTKLCKGIYINIYPAEWLGIRFAGNLGYLQGDDAQAPNKGGAERFRLSRNLKFQSKLSEAYGAIEFYPTVFLEQYEGLQGKLRPYGLIGVGIFHFNPQGEYAAPNGTKQWVDLKPLRLEGQGMAEYSNRSEYPLTQMMIPMGGGFKYYLKENFYVGFEILHRKTFTDYIDDVSTNYIDPRYFDQYLAPAQAAQARQLSYRENIYNPGVSRRYINLQRGDPKENDAFFSGMLRLGYRVNGSNSPSGRAKRQLKCPVFY
ncbi:MAG TPA: hypothetical protein VMZ03_06105 [Chitinophagaceae bacterium]|nr:hypothetical protein [Chitinophagaceae bacterium]